MRTIIREALDRDFLKMRKEGRNEADIADLRSSSLQWQRHTTATLNADARLVKHLQVDPSSLRSQPKRTSTTTLLMMNEMIPLVI